MIQDDFFLCRTFAKAIGSDQLEKTFEQRAAPISVSLPAEKTPTEPVSTWKVGDACLCPFSEDQMMYKATILDIASPSCHVSFDEYGNEEEHLLTELQLPIEEEAGEDEGEEIVVPSPPPMPEGISSDLSSTLMSWYLAGYHTGFYQAMKK